MSASQLMAALVGGLIVVVIDLARLLVTDMKPRMSDRCRKPLRPSGCGDTNYRCEREANHGGTCAAHDEQFDVWWKRRDGLL